MIAPVVYKWHEYKDHALRYNNRYLWQLLDKSARLFPTSASLISSTLQQLLFPQNSSLYLPTYVLSSNTRTTMMTAATQQTNQIPKSTTNHRPTAAVGRYEPFMSGEQIILRHYPQFSFFMPLERHIISCPSAQKHNGTFLCRQGLGETAVE